MEVLFSVEPEREEKLKEAIETGKSYDYREITFKNIDIFYRFITKNVKADYIDFEKYIDELRRESHYELGKVETKSGKPETISYDYKFDYDEEFDETKNEVIEF